MWHAYLLSNSYTGSTYIGCTTDPERRLRQHNRELKGGARSTLNGYGHWRLLVTLSGFANKSEAMRWEKILKSRYKGLAGRSASFKLLSMGVCPVGQNGKGKLYEPPKNLEFKLYA